MPETIQADITVCRIDWLQRLNLKPAIKEGKKQATLTLSEDEDSNNNGS